MLVLILIFIQPLISDGVSWFWELDDSDIRVNGVKRENTLDKPEEWPQKLTQCNIDGFKLTNYIANGAQGRVFRAQNDSGEAVAIKFFKNENDRNKEHLILDKFNLLNPKSQVLVHKIPGTPTTCCDGGIYCLVEEFVEGETLTNIMKRNGLNTCDPELIENCETKLKPLNVKLVQRWILQALVGHRDMEMANIANADQNLRNILWDEKNQKIKFVDMGFAREQYCWSRYTFEFQNVDDLKQPCITPQSWAYLALFLPKENERKEYWQFLKQITTIQTAQKALDFAISETGYLNEISKQTDLYLEVPRFETPNPTNPNIVTDPNPTNPDDSNNASHNTKNFDYARYLCMGGAILLLLVLIIIVRHILIRKRKRNNQQTSCSEM